MVPAIPQLVYPGKIEHTSTNDLYMNIHSSFHCNNQKWSTIHMSIIRCMAKQTVVYPTVDYYSTLKINIFSNLDESQNN